MLLISKNFTGTNQQHKAPRNMMWIVESISISSETSVNAHLMFVDREARPSVITSLANTIQRIIGSFSLTIAGVDKEITGINQKTKYVSVGLNVAGSPDVKYQVFGELIRASRKELLIEWFTKKS